MITWSRTKLYPAVLVATNSAVGTLCFETGALGVAIVLWATAATICLSLLSGPLRALSDGGNGWWLR